MAEPLIDVAGLAKSYGSRTVVRDVTLRLMPGAIVGLVGANGGGKTTTLRMFAGLLRPDQGAGSVLGDDIRSTAAARRARVGYMPQRLSLYPELTVAENLRFRADVHGLVNARDHVAATAARWGLDPVLATRFERLSGGWGRRVQFAATMLHAPPLLLLDEPTAGLDVVTRTDIWRWLIELAGRGHSAVIATHDLAEAERCPIILHYRDGQVEGPIAPSELIEKSRTATLEAAVAALAPGAKP
ncbi:ABC transporter ATP-binding protein [Sphingomonas sp. AR_OL41]|uniref:ABC transporter ATP-binding protein n=1 Tax=Sphingomonas sp. AR_OL41 TaxID=3042729 RepID=UPI002480E0D1|nr:ABC transporter ATP-binding protein [Sphingomonas sp. AR_OL41]MDH7971587.1 ABC transporter ATP-binding protein [Sphingomonas sp. AR_OL41]